MTTQTQEAEIISQTISILLEKICKQYMSDTSMLPLILSDDAQHIKSLQIIDCLYQSVLTSLQFGQYRRAVWYLQALSSVCEKSLGRNSREEIVQTLQKHMRERK